MLSETLTFLRSLKALQQQNDNHFESSQELDAEPVLIGSTAQDLLQFLGIWEEDDFEECLNSLYKSRSNTQF